MGINAIECDIEQGTERHAPAAAANLQRNEDLTLAIPKNDSFSEEMHYRKRPRPLSHVESKSSPGILMPRPYNRVASYQPSIGGMTSTYSETDHNSPPPSTDKEKSKHTR